MSELRAAPGPALAPRLIVRNERNATTVRIPPGDRRSTDAPYFPWRGS